MSESDATISVTEVGASRLGGFLLSAEAIADTHWFTNVDGTHCVGCGWRAFEHGEDFGRGIRRHVAEVAVAAVLVEAARLLGEVWALADGQWSRGKPFTPTGMTTPVVHLGDLHAALDTVGVPARQVDEGSRRRPLSTDDFPHGTHCGHEVAHPRHLWRSRRDRDANDGRSRECWGTDSDEPSCLPAQVGEAATVGECTCVMDCRDCSRSGDWHVHSDDLCIVHPDAEVS